jgi:hypothetical protein
MSVPKNIYVGKRYIPKQCGDWNNGNDYESLSVVLWQGASYTSKQDVPRGVDIGNTKYWVRSADYNAQVAIYEQNVRDYHQYVIDQIGVINDSYNDFIAQQTLNFNTFTQDNSNKVNLNLSQLNTFGINVKYPPLPLNGAKCDGITDDSDALISIIQFASDHNMNVFLANYTIKITKPLIIDVAKTSLVGNGAYLDFSNMVSGNTAITITSSADYTNRFKHNKKVIDGVYIHGGIQTNISNNIGISIGQQDATTIDNFTIDNFSIEGFVTNIQFSSHSWRVKISNGQVRWGNVVVPSGLNDFGECMVFENIIFCDGTSITINDGEFKFDKCSFDNAPLNILGGNVTVDKGHFEKPLVSNTPTDRYITVGGLSGTACYCSHCMFINGYSNFKYFPLYVDDVVKSGGLILESCNFATAGSISCDNETRTDKILFTKQWIGGKGRTQIKNCTSQFTPSSSNPASVGTSYRDNRVINGNVDNNHIFATQFTGTALTPSIVTDVNAPNGKALQFNTTNINAGFEWKMGGDCKSGEVISFATIAQLNVLSGDSVNFSMRFEDYDGNSISLPYTQWLTANVSNTSYQKIVLGSQIAPIGATKAFVSMQLLTGATVGSRTINIGQTFISGI